MFAPSAVIGLLSQPPLGVDGDRRAGGEDGRDGPGLLQEAPLRAVDRREVEVDRVRQHGVDFPDGVIDLIAQGFAAARDAKAPMMLLEEVFVRADFGPGEA